MKKSIGLFVLTIALFCGRSNGVINCGPNKFPVLNTESKPNFRQKESSDLSGILCRSLLGKTGQNHLLMACTLGHIFYFKEVNVVTATIEKYADFCSKYNTKGSCYMPHSSPKLLSRLMYYCWTMNDIAESNKNVFNKDLEITPDDWKTLYDVENINLPSCFDQISSENIDEKGPKTVVGSVSNIKFQNLELLKGYKKSLNNRKSYCNCVEILGLNVIFDTCISKNIRTCQPSDRVTFIEDVCIKSNKKHFWTKKQLKAISDYVADSKEVTSYNFSLKKLTIFLTEAHNLANKRWYSSEPNNKNSKWPVSYVLKTSSIDSNTNFGQPMVSSVFNSNNLSTATDVTIFDKTKFDVMAKAIFHGFSTNLFEEFISVTNEISLPLFTYPYNKWECKKLILDTFFDYNRSKNLPCIKYENFQYNVGTVKHVNEHLSLFKQLVPESMDCRSLRNGIKTVLNQYYTYWFKLDRSHLTSILTSAVNNQQNLWTVANCLKFSSSIEKTILEKQLFIYPNLPSGLEANDITSFETNMLNELRGRIFRTKEIYDMCNKRNPNLKTVMDVLEILYTKDLPDLFIIPDENI